MNSNNDDDFAEIFRYLQHFFNSLMNGEVTYGNQMGYCNCCFMENEGNFVKYTYKDGTTVQLFICNICSEACLPEQPCRLAGCNFIKTHDIYVNNKDNINLDDFDIKRVSLSRKKGETDEQFRKRINDSVSKLFDDEFDD